MDSSSIFPIAFLAILGAFMLLFLALLLVSSWKLFVKMGEPGWKSIIPFYSSWVLIRRLGKPQSWFWIILICSLIGQGLSGYVQIQTAAQIAAGVYTPFGLLWINLLSFAFLIVLLVYSILLSHALSKAFGHEAAFTVGLVLLPIVFLPILAFGPDKFQLAQQKDLAIE